MMYRASVLAAALLVVGSCAGPTSDATQEEGVSGWRPDLVCPGDPSGACELVEDAPVHAGAGVRSILPSCYEDWIDLNGDAEYDSSTESFRDCGCDRLCEEDEGYPGVDEGEADGVFQAVWIGGFQHGRAATGVRGADVGLRGEGDGLWVRAAVLEQGHTRVALVSVDLVGWFYDEVVATRQELIEAGVDIDHLVISATHVHEGPDTMGIWGKDFISSGYDAEYAAEVRAATVEAIGDAVEALESVVLHVGAVDVASYSDERGVANVIRDSRDPWVIDPTVHAARFVGDDGATVVSLVTWANHPETVADRNTLFTSDYVHTVRKTVEEGSNWDSASRSGIGGICVFFAGAVGGMMTSLGVTTSDPDGYVWGPSASFEKADVIGTMVGEMALDALEGASIVVDPQLGVRASEIFLPIENQGFQAMFLVGVLEHRSTHNWDESQPITAGNLPEIQTQVSVVDIGPLQILTIPGELFPELAVGGYDGTFVNAPGIDVIDPENSFPPDLDAAPQGPYLRDLMTGEHRWIWGLANDEIGYIIPPYDFILHGSAPYILEPDGEHYEETNSLGPQTAPLIQDLSSRLLSFGA